MDPNSTTKISGNASVQNSAARSRVKLLMFATVRSSSAFTSSVPEGPAGQVEEDVLERRAPDAEVGRLEPERLRCREHRTDRPGAVARGGDHLAGRVLAARGAGHRPEAVVRQGRDRLEPDRALLEVVADELLDRPLLEDLAVVHDRDAVAQDLGLLEVVRREEHR